MKTVFANGEEVDQLIGYAVKQGYVDDSAVDWTSAQKQSYFNKCNAYSPENDV